MALVVGALIQHPAAAVHADGVTAAEVGLQAGVVAAALVAAALEAPVLVPMDSSPPGSSVHGILQARTLQWVAILFMGPDAMILVF